MTTASAFLANYMRATATIRFLSTIANLRTSQPSGGLLGMLLHTESGWETSWCRVLAWLLEPGERDVEGAHLLRSQLLSAIIGTTKFNKDRWYVVLERPTSDGGRIDISLESLNQSALVIIEAKLDHDESIDQVRRYATYARSLGYSTVAGVLVTLSEGDLTDADLAASDFRRIRWSEIAGWIQDALADADDPPPGHPWPAVAAEFIDLIAHRSACDIRQKRSNDLASSPDPARCDGCLG